MIKFTDTDEIEAAFKYYRKNGFPYPQLSKFEKIHIFRALQKSINRINKHDEALLGGSKILTREGIGDVSLANFFHPHIWSSHAVGMRSPVESFGIDKSLRKVFAMCLQYDGIIEKENFLKFLKFVNGTQVCSNFRPAAAKAIYDYFKCNNTLDMSTGYGGRLLGFLASKAKGTYIGVDPSEKTYQGNQCLAKSFKSSDRVKLICKPFEEVDITELGSPDLAFTSPPYFVKEIYDENAATQSRERYSCYKSWRKHFLFIMLEKTYIVLPKNGILALNIANIRIKNEVFPLVADTEKFAKRLGFRLIDTFYFQISGFGAGVMGPKWEPILVFRK